MLYRDPKRVLDGPLDTGDVVTTFKTPDGVEHKIAKVTAPDAIRSIVDHIGKSSLLIADGHHRYETALYYSQEIDHAEAATAKSYLPRPEHRYFMSFLCNGDDPDLVVFATHRLVHSLPSFGWDDFLAKAREIFDVAPQNGELPAAEAALARAGKSSNSFLAVARPNGTTKMALLTLRQGLDLDAHPTLGQRPRIVRGTDVAVLHSGILEHMLGISLDAQVKKTNLTYLQDPKQGLSELASGAAQIFFVMNPTPVAQVREVAEAGEVMPQKSTYFYPKVLTGLAIHTLDPYRAV
jgi:uncharacterized protein (DUF1015 family)